MADVAGEIPPFQETASRLSGPATRIRYADDAVSRVCFMIEATVAQILQHCGLTQELTAQDEARCVSLQHVILPDGASVMEMLRMSPGALADFVPQNPGVAAETAQLGHLTMTLPKDGSPLFEMGEAAFLLLKTLMGNPRGKISVPQETWRWTILAPPENVTQSAPGDNAAREAAALQIACEQALRTLALPEPLGYVSVRGTSIGTILGIRIVAAETDAMANAVEAMRQVTGVFQVEILCQGQLVTSFSLGSSMAVVRGRLKDMVDRAKSKVPA